MVVTALVVGLVLIFTLVFRFSKEPAVPVSDDHRALSEVFPYLPEEDLIWYRDHGGYEGRDIYPIKVVRR